jgi:intracellular multiplication protein IcmE
MASRKENLKALFSNARTRLIIVFTLSLLFITILIGYFKFSSAIQGPEATATVSTAPTVRSIPGSTEPIAEYAQLQEKQNVDQAQQAQKTGQSAIPTIIRSHAIDENVEVVGGKGTTGVGFSSLARESDEDTKRSLWLDALKKGNCSQAVISDVRKQGAKLSDIKQACSCTQLKQAGISIKELEPHCPCNELKAAGYNAFQLKEAGYTARRLRDCGFTACELKAAGFTAAEMKDAGYTEGELRGAGYKDDELAKAFGTSAAKTQDRIRDAGCRTDALIKLRQSGISAAAIKRTNGCSAAQLKAAGFTPEELTNALFSPDEIRAAGFSAAELAKAGIAPPKSDLLGVSALQKSSSIAGLPQLTGRTPQAQQAAANNAELQSLIDAQNRQLEEQKYQQVIQQKTSEMLSAAQQSIQNWKAVALQVYMEGQKEEKKEERTTIVSETGAIPGQPAAVVVEGAARAAAIIKTGDIVFAVLDTSINSDEPGPILATIVSGRLKGAKLIGSFNLPANAGKMIISFNMMSVPGAPRTTSISAVAIDPDTARTALSSRTNRHILLRYGSLFASSFLQGFGNAFQSANTVVRIGGTGGGNDITIQNGIGRSTLQNAVIALATVGKTWGQQAQQIFNTPTTVQVYSGTAIGVLFTQDLVAL